MRDLNAERFEGRGGACSYLLFLRSKGVVVDPSDRIGDISKRAREEKLTNLFIFLSSSSFDHGARAEELRSEWKAKIFAPPRALEAFQHFPQLGEKANLCGVRSPQISKILREDEQLEVDGQSVQILSRGDRSFWLEVDNLVFLGGESEERDGKLYENGTLIGEADLRNLAGKRIFPGRGFPFDAK